MREFEVYKILCIDDSKESTEQLREKFKDFPHTMICFLKRNSDPRFILKNIEVDLILVNEDSSSIDIEKQVHGFKSVLGERTPILFYSGNSDGFIHDIFNISSFFLPDLEDIPIAA